MTLMNVLAIYPRGYTTGPVDAPARQVSAGDLVVDSLYDYLVSSRGRQKNWKFHGQILDAALVHFGDFHTWLDSQLSNPHLSGPKRDYLIDTLSFINGQARIMDHTAWMYVLDEVNLRAEQVNIQRYFESSQFLKQGLTTIQILQQWCERPDGINDLITTLYVLFGHVGRTPA